MATKREVILGLDISSASTGWCVLRNGRWNKSNNSFGIIKTSSKDTLPVRLYKFREELHKLIKNVKPTHIVIEEVFAGRNISTLKLLARFSGVGVELARRCLKKDPEIVLATKARSIVGCGTKKEDAFSYVCERYNLDWSINKMNDVADALVLALYQRELIKG